MRCMGYALVARQDDTTQAHVTFETKSCGFWSFTAAGVDHPIFSVYHGDTVARPFRSMLSFSHNHLIDDDMYFKHEVAPAQE